MKETEPITQPNAYRCEISGVWMYRKVPDGMRLATEKDFRRGMRLNIGLKYLVKSFHSDLYHAYKITQNTKYEDILPFIKANHVYIKE